MGGVAGYAAAYGGYEESVLLVLTGEGDETLYGLTGAGETFHGGDGVALALEALTVTPLCSEMVKCKAGGTSGVVAEVVGAEDEDLAGLESFYALRSYTVVFHIECVLIRKDKSFTYLWPRNS